MTRTERAYAEGRERATRWVEHRLTDAQIDHGIASEALIYATTSPDLTADAVRGMAIGCGRLAP